ncbi:MAG: GspE/PulE family protein, partial [Telluria sp.]
MHPLTALAQCKLVSAQPPHRLLTLDLLTEWCATKVGLPFIRIDPLKIDFTKVADVMSASYAARFNILPVEMTSSTLVVATADPASVEWEAEIAKVSRRKIELVLANPLDIGQYISQFFSLAKSIRDANRNTGQDLAMRNNFEQLVELGKSNKQFDANDQHIVNIVDWLWSYAFEQRASDIHLEPKREFAVIRFRIDGILHQVYQVPAVVMIAMTARIKLLGRMDVIEKRRPQDGRIKTRTAGGQEVELRLSTLPTAFGEKLVMRIFDPEVVVKTLPELGFPPDDAERWDALTNRPHGIILVTGPTGSGKTTTLYTTLKALATSEVNVCTVEDPIEMVEAAFNQMQVQPGIDLSFADGVRALMRQDPDIIMVGEIRDLPTAEMAIQAALTGHLVFSTLHTNDAPAAVVRLLE